LAPTQLALLLSSGFQMNLKFAPLTLRMLVTMFWKAGTKSPAQLARPVPDWLQMLQAIQLPLNSQPSRM
jgi:hypothetical protein